MNSMPASRLPAAAFVHEQLACRLRSGHFGPGTRLPAERLLAAEFKVSRPVVRQAINQLVGRGLLEIRPRKGVFATGEATAPDISPLGRILDDQIDHILALYEVRKRLEVQTAELAAEFATPADVAELNFVYDEFDRVFADRTARDRVDAAFHSCLARASGNPVLYEVLESLHRALEEQPLIQTVKDHDTDHYIREARRQHRQIIDAIARHDPAAAGQLLAGHIDVVARQTPHLARRQANRAGAGASRPLRADKPDHA
jgi:GntR family transcriptional repressor for pyruvate dehydrogenase complex